MTYSDHHLRRKLESYGLKPVPQIDAYPWPADAPTSQALGIPPPSTSLG